MPSPVVLGIIGTVATSRPRQANRPILTPDSVYVSTGADNRVHELDKRTGERKRSFKLARVPVRHAVIVGGTFVSISRLPGERGRGTFSSYDLKSERELWSHEVATQLHQWAPLARTQFDSWTNQDTMTVDEDVIVTHLHDSIEAFATRSGKRLWKPKDTLRDIEEWGPPNEE